MTFAARPIGATVFLLGCAFFQGCTPTVQIGPREMRGAADFQHPVAEKTENPCKALQPIPETVHIAIEPGEPVMADHGGEELLRSYIAQRHCSKRITR